MKHKKYTQLGFTLLELLVVISIIGILLALGVVAFSTAQKKSRDAKRTGDVKALQNGFEQYYAANGSYADCATMKADGDVFPGGAPTDPKDGLAYSCSEDTNLGDITGYCICAELEAETGNADDSNCTNLGSPTVSDPVHYCLTNLQ